MLSVPLLAAGAARGCLKLLDGSRVTSAGSEQLLVYKPGAGAELLIAVTGPAY